MPAPETARAKLRQAEAEARAAILANGYTIERQADRLVTVREPRKRGEPRQWTGVSFRDLVQSFNLDQRKAGR